MLNKKEQTAHNVTLAREQAEREDLAKAQEGRRAKRGKKRAKTKG